MENEVVEPLEFPTVELEPAPAEPSQKRRRPRTKKTNEAPPVDDGHCPACKMGQDLAKGEGTHVLNTVEHPVQSPSVAEKAVKVRTAPMPKAFKSASYFAEKQLPKLLKDKVRAELEVMRLEKEIQECIRVIQALGGQMPVGMPAAPAPQFNSPITMHAIMSDAPLNIATMPPISRAGGGAMEASLAAPVEDDENAFLNMSNTGLPGGGWS